MSMFKAETRIGVRRLLDAEPSVEQALQALIEEAAERGTDTDAIVAILLWKGTDLANDLANATRSTETTEPVETPASYRCVECKSTTGLQVAMWVDPNTSEVFDDYGSWGSYDTKYCAKCQGHVLFESVPTDGGEA